MSSTVGSTGLSIADLIGIVVGGVLGIATIIGLICTCYQMCGKKNQPSQVAPYPQQYSQQAPYGAPTNTGYYHPQNPYPPNYYADRPPPNYASHQQPYYGSQAKY